MAKKTIEVPDFIIKNGMYPSSRMEITIQKDKICFYFVTDGTGDVFTIPRKDFEEKLK